MDRGKRSVNMKEQELFKKVYDQVLDYDGKLISRCAEWGLNTYNILKINGRLLGTMDAEDKDGVFIYAVSTAVAVGLFGKIAFGGYFPDEHEFDLDLLNLRFDDIKGYLDGYPDIDQARFEQLRAGNYVNLTDIWATIFEYNKETHKGLYEYYKKQGETDSTLPDYAIFESLVSIFERKDEEEEGVVISPFQGTEGEMESYLYVSQGFSY